MKNKQHAGGPKAHGTTNQDTYYCFEAYNWTFNGYGEINGELCK